VLLRFLAVLIVLVLSVPAVSAQAITYYTWLGNGTDDNFSTAANWVSGPPPSGVNNALGFVANTGANPSNVTATLDANVATSGSPAAFEVSQIQFGGVNTPFTLNAGAGAPTLRFLATSPSDTIDISIGSTRTAAATINIPITTGATGSFEISNFGSGGLTLNNSVNISSSLGFTIAGTGTTTINGPIALNNNSLTITASVVNLNGVISSLSQSNGVNFNSNGTLTLSAANTFTGQFTVGIGSNTGATGTVRLVGGDNRLNPALTVQFNDASRIDLNGNNQQIARFVSFAASGTPRIINTSATTSTFTLAQSTGFATVPITFGETGGDNFNFRYSPPTTVTATFTATNTYTGTTTITNGTMALSGTGSIARSSKINLDANTNFIVTGLTGGNSYDSGVGGFALKPNQTLNGRGLVLGNVLIDSSATLQPGYGSATESLSIRGLTRIMGNNSFAPSAKWVVVAQDQPGNIRSNQLIVLHPDQTTNGKLDLVTGNGLSLSFLLSDGGGLKQGVAYKFAIANTPAISRNGVNVSTVTGGENYTFLASDYVITSNFVFTNSSLSAESGILYLSFTPVPEPATILVCASLGLVGWRRVKASLTRS
jgi:fibronectin-binding autotransporter adhesin